MSSNSLNSKNKETSKAVKSTNSKIPRQRPKPPDSGQPAKK